jgi:hypothetical protein
MFCLNSSCLVLLFFISTAVNAHVVGLSKGEYRFDGSDLRAELVFARPELASSVPGLDANQDGLLSEQEVADARNSVNETIIQPLDVKTNTGVCTGIFQKAMLVEQHGLAIRALYHCNQVPDAGVFKFKFLERLSFGHRHLVTVMMPNTSRRFVAYAGNAIVSITPLSDQASGPVGDVQASTVATGWSLLHLGIEHILTGYDHLVFLLGLILVGGRMRSLLLAITAFTIAHSITLGLATLGVWGPAPSVIEPAIALTITYVGVENWFLHDAARRWQITFPFGLIHGFGFAGALQEIAIPQEQIPMALLAFNGGVEIGQIAVLLIVLPVIMCLRRQYWFVRNGIKSVSTAIAIAGGCWFIARVI